MESNNVQTIVKFRYPCFLREKTEKKSLYLLSQKCLHRMTKLCLRHIIALSWLFLALSVMAQERAQPIAGDGVYSFLRRHGRDVPGDVQAFRELNQGRFNARGQMILGRYYTLPPRRDGATPATPTPSGRGTPPAIFGTRFQDMSPLSTNLRGAVFYIIAGHGGPDPGAITRIGNRTLHEVEYNYDFALRLARNLMRHGATVHIIIQTPGVGIRDDRYLANHRTQTTMGQVIPRAQLDRLRQRVDAVNRLYQIDRQNYSYARAIEIHVDSRAAHVQIDLFMYYHSTQPSARQTAETLLREMERQYRIHQPNRGFSGHISHRNLYILREMNPPAIMVEVGNFQNARDRERILNHNNRQAVANWLTNGLIEDFRRHRNQ